MAAFIGADKILSFQRRATAADYVWNEEMGAYVLSFETRFRPGVITASPAEGAVEFNLYLDELPRRLAQGVEAVAALRTLVEDLQADRLDPAFADIARAMLLHLHDPARYGDAFTERDTFKSLTDDQCALLLLAFTQPATLNALLTPAVLANFRFRKK